MKCMMYGKTNSGPPPMLCCRERPVANGREAHQADVKGERSSASEQSTLPILSHPLLPLEGAF